MRNKTERDLLLPLHPLSQKLDTLLGETEVVQRGTIPRKEWLKQLETAMKGGVLVMMIDFCGRSCDRYDRDWPQLFASLDQSIHWLAEILRLRNGTKLTIGRRHRESGEDEALFFIPLKLLKQAPEEIIKLFYSHLNRDHFKAYVAGAHLPPHQEARLQEVLRVADLSLNRAKGEYKADGRGVTIASLQGKQWQLNDQPVPPEQLRIEKYEFPDFLITSDPVRQIKELQENGWQPFLLFSPNEMKKINAQIGMTKADELLSKLVEEVNSYFETNLGQEEYKMVKIGVLFVVMVQEPRVNEVDILKLANTLGEISTKLKLPHGLGWELYPSLYNLEPTEKRKI